MSTLTIFLQALSGDPTWLECKLHSWSLYLYYFPSKGTKFICSEMTPVWIVYKQTRAGNHFKSSLWIKTKILTWVHPHCISLFSILIQSWKVEIQDINKNKNKKTPTNVNFRFPISLKFCTCLAIFALSEIYLTSCLMQQQLFRCLCCRLLRCSWARNAVSGTSA